MTAVISETKLETLRQRRSAGESFKTLAQEAGIPWQRLWGMLLGPMEKGPMLRVNPKAASLTEKYRPTCLDALWGQQRVVDFLKRFAAHPYPTTFLFEGETGTGKSSAALALAAAVGCDVAQNPPEFGGLTIVASGEQTAETVRDLEKFMWRCPFHGSGWKVVVVNEADRMHPAVETIWLDRLEALPQRTVVVFTTNYAGKLSQRFLDRCTRLGFESDAQKLRASAERFATAVWKAETGKRPDPAKVRQIVQAAEADGHLSFRRVVQDLTVALGSEGEHDRE